MALSGVSLNAATSTGPGAAIMFDTPKSNASSAVSGASGAVTLLEGTIDGVNFVLINQISGNGWLNSSGTVMMGARAYLEGVQGGDSVTASLAAA
jgi:hypothetical protein